MIRLVWLTGVYVMDTLNPGFILRGEVVDGTSGEAGVAAARTQFEADSV
jgi:hypothetical protein